MNKQRYVSLKQMCAELSISEATGKNWVKTGQLIPSYQEKGCMYFLKEYAQCVKRDITSGDRKVLRSRRNKRYISGNGLYHSYVSEKCINVSVVNQLLMWIAEKELYIDERILSFLLADCAIKLLYERRYKEALKPAEMLCDFADGKLHFGQADALIWDILKAGFDMETDMNSDIQPDRINENIRVFAQQHENLLNCKYVYEAGEDVLGLLYISCKNLKDRKAKGSYYTPTKIVKSLVEQLFDVKKQRHCKIIDPCCGTGNFLLQLPEHIAIEEIYGNDIDVFSVCITRFNLLLRCPDCEVTILYHNITNEDYLRLGMSRKLEDSEKFDYMIGNPPWGCNFSQKEKREFRSYYNTASSESVESYDLFLECALQQLKCGGILCFVLPESVLTVKTHEMVRKLIMENCQSQYVEYLGDTFDKVQCPSIIWKLQYSGTEMDCQDMIVKESGRCFRVRDKRQMKSEYFSFTLTDEEDAIRKKLYNEVDVTFLQNQAHFAMGIVTGNNNQYITDSKSCYNEVVLKGMDIRKYQICNPNRFMEFRPELFHQSAPEKYYRASEKLVYRFIGNQLIFAYDDQQRISLNSCNIVIPQIPDMRIKYILAVLNSSIAQFIFSKTFRAVKVLKSHVEQIPIPIADAQTQLKIEEIVDELLILAKEQQMNIQQEKNWKTMYQKLDIIIKNLFLLTEEEYLIVNR